MGDLKRITQRLEEGIEVALLATPIDLIVMGPGLDEVTPAAELRRGIIEAAAEFGAVIKPEHDQLVTAASAKLGEGHSLTAYEMFLVEAADLVVIVPDSPGSFCELGLFSFYEESGRKLLILVNTEFKGASSYIAEGPLTIAAQNRADVHYVDYSDFSSTWEIVRARLQQLKVTRSLDKLTDPRRR